MSSHTLTNESPSALKKQRAPKEEIDFALDQIDMYRMRVPRDGNSLLRCMALQLYNTQMFSTKMRAALVRFMERHRAAYEGRTPMNYDQYLSTLSQDGVECSTLEIVALSLLYQCNIYKHDSHEVSRPRRLSDPAKNYKNSIFVYCPPVTRGSSTNGEHYDLVLPKTKLSVAGMCQGITYNSLYSRVFGLGSAVDIFVHLMLNNSVDPSMNAALNIPLAEKLGITTDMPVGIVSPSFGAHAVPDGLSHTSPTGQIIDDIRTVLQELGPPFPYKVAKSIATFVYRNPDQDVFAEKTKEKSRVVKRRIEPYRSSETPPTYYNTGNYQNGGRSDCYQQRYNTPLPTITYAPSSFTNNSMGSSSIIGSPPNMLNESGGLPSPGMPYSPRNFSSASNMMYAAGWSVPPPPTPAPFFIGSTNTRPPQQFLQVPSNFSGGGSGYATPISRGYDQFIMRSGEGNMPTTSYLSAGHDAAAAFVDALNAQMQQPPPPPSVKPFHFNYNTNAIAAAAANVASAAGGRSYQHAFFTSPTPQGGFFPLSPTPCTMAGPPPTPHVPSRAAFSLNPYTATSSAGYNNAPLSPLPASFVAGLVSPGLMPSFVPPWTPAPTFSLHPSLATPQQPPTQFPNNFGFRTVADTNNDYTTGMWIPSPSLPPPPPRAHFQQQQQQSRFVMPSGGGNNDSSYGTKYYYGGIRRTSPTNQPHYYVAGESHKKSGGNLGTAIDSCGAAAASRSTVYNVTPNCTTSDGNTDATMPAAHLLTSATTVAPDSPASPKSSTTEELLMFKRDQSPLSPAGGQPPGNNVVDDETDGNPVQYLATSARNIKKIELAEDDIGVNNDNDSGLADACDAAEQH